MIGPILRRAEAGRQPGFREIALLLQANGTDHQALLEAAGRITRACRGEGTTSRGVISLAVESTLDAPVEAACAAVRMGCKSVIIQREGPVDPDRIGDLVRRIKRTVPVHLALCLGERSYDDYALWRHAGVDQYILPHETCNLIAYAQLFPGRTPADRVTRYLWLRGLGYEVGGGLLTACVSRDSTGVVGDLEMLMNINTESVVIRQDSDPADLYKLLAVLRLCLPSADLWVKGESTEIESTALNIGANVRLVDVCGVPRLPALARQTASFATLL